MRKIRNRILFVISSIIISLFILKGVDTLLGFYLTSSGYFKIRRPGLTETVDSLEFKVTATASAQGLRNEEVAVPKPEKVYRIFALGDSFTYGWGVDLKDTWVKKLQESLVIPDKNVEVINLGMTDFDLGTEVFSCRVYRKRFSPDAYVVGMYITEDLIQLVQIENYTSSLNKIATRFFPFLNHVSNPYLDPLVTKETPIADNTISVRTIWKNQVNFMVKENPKILKSLPQEILSDFLNGKVHPAMVSLGLSFPDFWVTILEKERIARMLPLFEEKIGELKKDCAGDKPVFILGIPSFELFDQSLWPYRTKLGFTVSDQLLTIDIDAKLAQVVKKYGMTYIPLLTHFRQKGCPGCYYPWDSHLTPEGHSQTAQFALTYLQSLQ